MNRVPRREVSWPEGIRNIFDERSPHHVLALLIGVMLGCLLALAPVATEAQNVNLSNNVTNSVAPQIAVSGQNVYVVWSDGPQINAEASCSACEILFRRSTDGGQTWSPQPDVPATNLSNSVERSTFPTVVASGNVILVFWAEYGTSSVDLVYRRSTDGGQIFGPTRPIRTGVTGVGLFQAIFVGSQIHAVWIECCAPSEFVLYSRSLDGGVTFSPAISMSASSPDSGPHLAVEGDTVVIASQEGDRAPRVIRLRASTDGGATFRDVNVSAPLAQPLSGGPKVAVMGTAIHVFWQESSPEMPGLLYRRSTDGGANFGSIQTLSGPEGTADHQAVSSGANLYVAWRSGGPPAGVFLRRSDNGGASFASKVELRSSTEGVNARPQVAVRGSQVVVAWEQSQGFGPPDVGMRRSSDGGATWAPPLDEPPTNLSMNPGDSAFAQVAATATAAYVVWTDRTSGNYEVLVAAIGSGLSTEPFVPPVRGPIRYAPCPMDAAGSFDPDTPSTWYSTAWSGRYSNAADRCEGTGGHPGVDIRDRYAESTGDPTDFGVHAIGPGVVIEKGSFSGFGKTIVIRHENVIQFGTVYSIYAHLDSFEKKVQRGKEGQISVERGERIGTMGWSGLKSVLYRHLHFQLQGSWDKRPFWPKSYPSKPTGKCPGYDDCLTDDQRAQAAAAVQANTVNPMWFVENAHYERPFRLATTVYVAGATWTSTENLLIEDGIAAQSCPPGTDTQLGDFEFSGIAGTILGIEVACTAAKAPVNVCSGGQSGVGNLEVAMSWDRGTSSTARKDLPSPHGLTTTLTSYTVGGPADTWGRLWSPGDFTNANFRLLVGHSNNQGTFQVDSCAVLVTSTP